MQCIPVKEEENKQAGCVGSVFPVIQLGLCLDENELDTEAAE
jgi:hypothetical protein